MCIMGCCGSRGVDEALAAAKYEGKGNFRSLSIDVVASPDDIQLDVGPATGGPSCTARSPPGESAAGFMWGSIAGRLREQSSVDARRAIAVFDFDCTLSAVHLFKEMRSIEGTDEFRRNRSGFLTRIWGGEPRIAAMRRFLLELNSLGCSSEPPLQACPERFFGVCSAHQRTTRIRVYD
jgi:hypothetical protein